VTDWRLQPEGSIRNAGSGDGDRRRGWLDDRRYVFIEDSDEEHTREQHRVRRHHDGLTGVLTAQFVEQTFAVSADPAS
jgi:hypothetical protein